MKVLGAGFLLVCGALLGFVLAFWAIYAYIVMQPVKMDSEASWCGMSTSQACEVLSGSKAWLNDNIVTGLTVTQSHALEGLDLKVVAGTGLQVTHGAEDEYTPSDALEDTGYYNPETTLYGYKYQDAVDVTNELRLAQPYDVTKMQVVNTVPVWHLTGVTNE